MLALSVGCGEDSSQGSAHDHGDHEHPHDHDHDASDAGWVQTDSGLAELLQLPPDFPEPLVPVDNPFTLAKADLGRRLFYDVRLSGNDTQSCASCHEQAKAFTDGRAQSLGSTGQEHPRSAMGLANMAYLNVFTWGNPVMANLEKQTLVPMFGREPVELGLVDEESFVLELRGIPFYQEAFAQAYPGQSEPITLNNAVNAITSFERTLISGNSPYDKWLAGDESAVSDAAKRGFELFNGHPFECFHCHGGFNFTDSVAYVGNAEVAPLFHNTGLYNIDGKGTYPAPNTGVFEVTQKPEDMGHFRAPSLRNIAVTAPYMHDGSIATLAEVLDHYAAGGRTIHDGPNKGVGSKSPLKSDLVLGFAMTEQERAEVIAFLESLTDEAFLTDPRFADPWVGEAP